MSNDSYKLIDSETGNIIEITNHEFSVGRSLKNNYILRNAVASRVHFVLINENNEIYLEDKSSNGTTINRSIIKGTKAGPLKTGDCIKIPTTNLKFIFQISSKVPPKTSEDSLDDEYLNSVVDNIIEKNVSPITQQEISHDIEESRKRTSDLNQDEPDLKRASPIPSNAINTSIITVNDTQSTTKVSSVLSPTKVLNTLTNCSIAASSNSATTSSDSASTDAVKTIPSDQKVNEDGKKDITLFNKFDVMEDELSCAICSELIIKAVTLNCSHSFCKYCIDEWKKQQKICPICRSNITSATPTLILDNFITKILENADEETKKRREEAIKTRAALEEKIKPSTSHGQRNNRGRRGRSGNRGRNNYHNQGSRRNNSRPSYQAVQTSSSSSTSSSSRNNRSTSRTTSEVIDISSEDESWPSDYDYYDDYPSFGRPFYGGFGVCFICFEEGHWANGCPNR